MQFFAAKKLELKRTGAFTELFFQVHQLTVKFTQTQTELNDEKQISKALQMNQVTWQNKFNALENEFKEYKKSKEIVSIICKLIRQLYLVFFVIFPAYSTFFRRFFTFFIEKGKKKG